MKPLHWKPSRRTLFAVIGVVAFILTGYVVLSLVKPAHNVSDSEEAKDTAKSFVPVRVAKAEVRTLTPTVKVIGNVQPEPERFSIVTTKTAGTVDALVAREGETVAKNDVIVKLDDRPATLALDRAEAADTRLIAKPLPEEATQARDEVEKNKSAAALAESRLKKAVELHARNPELVPEVELLDAKRANELAKTDLETAQAKLELLEQGPRAEVRRESKLAVEAAKLQLEYCQVRAPISGQVIEIKTYLGQWADVGTPLATILDTSEVLVQARIPSDRLKGILDAIKEENPHTFAIVRTPAFGDVEFPARDAWMSGQTEAQTSDVPIRLRVPNPNGLLRVGMTVQAELRELDVIGLAIPEVALTVDAEGNQMVTVIRDGKAVPTVVTTSSKKEPDVRAGGWVRIVQGLQPGEEVAVENGYALPKDTPVEVLPPRPSKIAAGRPLSSTLE